MIELAMDLVLMEVMRGQHHREHRHLGRELHLHEGRDHGLGDEFVAVCLSSGVQTEAALARRVELALARPISHNGTVITVGASVGSAVGLAGEDPAALVSRADQAMYRRKQQRRT